MAEKEEPVSRLPMLENIFGQPASLRGVLKPYEDSRHETLTACADAIRTTQGRIIFSGMGASFFAALPAVSRLEQQGYMVQAVDSAELLHYGSAALRPADVGVLISRSGSSVEVLRLAEKMRAVGMTVIGVTNVAQSSLSELVDLTLLIGSQPDQIIAVQTYTGTVLTMLLLAEQVLGQERARLNDACLAALPALSAYIEESFHASEAWRQLLDAPGPLYLLARGPALASAHEGALLLHETAKAAAVSMASGQFRHGPVEVVSDQFRAIVFGTPPMTRAMDRSLADDLLAMGAKVRWLGPATELSQTREHAEPLVPWPDFGPEFSPVFAPVLSPLFEIVPLQLAAYRLALWRGITPGDFRYASEITAEESGFPFFEEKIHQKVEEKIKKHLPRP